MSPVLLSVCMPFVCVSFGCIQSIFTLTDFCFSAHFNLCVKCEMKEIKIPGTPEGISSKYIMIFHDIEVTPTLCNQVESRRGSTLENYDADLPLV